mgnify:CR=1 FL=1
MGNVVIRPILPADNPHIARVIRSVLEDFNVPKTGTAYADVSLNSMYETYQSPRAAYYVLECGGKIVGGAGVASLEGYDGNVCELQKMYFLPEIRGRGWGAQTIDICLQKARRLGFVQCYLETMSYMQAAQRLYQKYGFQYLEGPMGDTGHHACGVHMILKLYP